MTKSVATEEDISALIAVQMVGCHACNGVSAPAIQRCSTDADGCNWEAWDWRGHADALLPCRLAMKDKIEGLKTFYVLPAVAEPAYGVPRESLL
jgi:hypothetical protein